MIYQGIESKIEIIKKLSSQLAEGGYLILGAGENLIGLSDEFEPILTCETVTYRKKLTLKRMSA